VAVTVSNIVRPLTSDGGASGRIVLESVADLGRGALGKISSDSVSAVSVKIVSIFPATNEIIIRLLSASGVTFDASAFLVSQHAEFEQLVSTAYEIPVSSQSIGTPGPAGPAGPQGAAGPAATVTAGTTTTSAAGTNASVVNAGTTSAAIFNFAIPRGATGGQGPAGADGAAGTAATIAVGTVATGAPGSPATVTNVGTSSAAIFDFSIPEGQAGSGSGGSSFVPTFLPPGATFTVPVNQQALFTLPIVSEGLLDFSGTLVEVG